MISWILGHHPFHLRGEGVALLLSLHVYYKYTWWWSWRRWRFSFLWVSQLNMSRSIWKQLWIMWSPDLATSMLWHVLPWQCYDREIKVFVTNDDDVVVSCGLSRPNNKKSRISRCTTCEVLTLTTSSSGPPTLARKTWQKKREKKVKKERWIFFQPLWQFYLCIVLLKHSWVPFGSL